MYKLEKYNQETQQTINQFIEDFQNIFPNKLSDEEIINRINTNLESDIIFTDDLVANCVGNYNLKTREMKILKDQQYIGKTIFHEFVHVLTKEFNEDRDNKYLSEVFTTLAEEKYCEYYGIKKKKRVNAYVPDFGHQLQLVYGDELLDRFLKEPSKMHLLFSTSYLPPIAAELMQKGTLKELAKNYNFIISNLGTNSDDVQLLEDIERVESLILSQFISRISNNPSKENLCNLERLYNSQFQPDYYLYNRIIEQKYKNGDIKKEYINQIPQLCNLYNMSEKDSFDDLKSYISGRKISQNNINFISHKIFGYSDLLIDEPFRESVYNRKNYKLNKDFYETLTNLVIDDSIEFDEIKGCSFSKEDSKDEINDIRVLLKNGEIDGYEKLINVLSREKSKKYFIYNENVLKNVIEDNILLTNMKSEDFCKQIKDSKVDITSLAQFLTKNSINEVFCDDYYLEEVKDILSAGDEYDFFIQDNDNAILKVSMEGIDRLSIKYDLIATTVPNQISVQKNRSRIK